MTMTMTAGWLTFGVGCGLLIVLATFRFGLAGFLVMLAVIAAVCAAILSTIH
jgi:hypothetical protein